MSGDGSTWEPGFYRLTQDVPNPGKVDRRYTQWTRLPVIAKGLFGLRPDPDLEGRLELVRFHMPGSPVTFNAPAGRGLHRKLVAAIKPHLVREDDTLKSVLWVAERSPAEVLRWLVEDGMLSVEDIKRMIQTKDEALAG